MFNEPNANAAMSKLVSESGGRFTNVVAFKPTGWSFDEAGVKCQRSGKSLIYGEMSGAWLGGESSQVVNNVTLIRVLPAVSPADLIG